MDEQYFEYRTGETHPRKNSRGLIAFLLICVIFLCGVRNRNVQLCKLFSSWLGYQKKLYKGIFNF